jgi:hypothetical protein
LAPKPNYQAHLAIGTPLAILGAETNPGAAGEWAGADVVGEDVMNGTEVGQRSRPMSRVIPALAIGVLLAQGCGGKYVWVDPRLDLRPHTPVGLVTFTVENARGSLHEVATQRFAESAFEGQDGIEILELGSADAVLAEVNEAALGSDAARAIGERYDVPAVFVGHLVVSDVKPSGGLPPWGAPHVEATVSVELRVRLLSTASGGTLWSRSARATETIGEVGIVDGRPYFGAEDPNEAYGRLVEELVWAVTQDLRPQRVRA